MPKTSSKCLNSLLDDDGMKDRQLVARASVDEYDTVEISNLLNKQESEEEEGFKKYASSLNLLPFYLYSRDLFLLTRSDLGVYEKRS